MERLDTCLSEQIWVHWNAHTYLCIQECMYTGRLLTSLKEERQKQTHTVCKIICGAERTETKAFDTDRVSVEIYTYYALSPIQIRKRHNHTNMIAAMCNAPYVMCYQKKIVLYYSTIIILLTPHIQPHIPNMNGWIVRRLCESHARPKNGEPKKKINKKHKT